MQVPSAAVRRAQQRYWRSNLLIMFFLLGVWAVVGLGCGVLWADWLNQWRLGGVPLGFWFAQQGSIVTFVVIILVYALTMNRLDANYHRQVAAAAPGNSSDPTLTSAQSQVTPEDDDSIFGGNEGGDA